MVKQVDKILKTENHIKLWEKISKECTEENIKDGLTKELFFQWVDDFEWNDDNEDIFKIYTIDKFFEWYYEED